MNRVPRIFKATDAIRSNVPLFVGLMGPSNSGKTFSALRLATGIQRIVGGEIFFIDTESKRSLHYAEQFKFKHVPFNGPFGSLDYLDAVRYCVGEGSQIIIIDSVSHEHIAEGGYLLTQEAEIDRMAGDDLAKRERVKMAGWIKPAKLRQQFITGLLQLNSNFIFCFRAKEKTKPVPGKQPLEMGFMPIAGEELLFEMTVNCLLLPKAGGVPTWRSDHIGEKLMMKLPMQFEKLFANQKPLDEDTGTALAEWARGNVAKQTEAISKVMVPSINVSGLVVEGYAAAEFGTEALRAFWVRLTPAEQRAIGGSAQLAEWKQAAAFMPQKRDTVINASPATAMSPVKDAGEPSLSPVPPASDRISQLLSEARTYANGGQEIFSQWLERLGAPDYELIQPHIEAVLTEVATNTGE